MKMIGMTSLALVWSFWANAGSGFTVRPLNNIWRVSAGGGGSNLSPMDTAKIPDEIIHNNICLQKIDAELTALQVDQSFHDGFNPVMNANFDIWQDIQTRWNKTHTSHWGEDFGEPRKEGSPVRFIGVRVNTVQHTTLANYKSGNMNIESITLYLNQASNDGKTYLGIETTIPLDNDTCRISDVLKSTFRDVLETLRAAQRN